jgi:SPP1 family predicted phage head-tail adaptor
MNPGKLDRLVTVQALTESRDTGGGIVSTYTTEAQVWAKRDDIGGREFRSFGQLAAEVTAVFTIRAYPGLTTKHRFIDGGYRYDLVAVQPDNRSGYQTVQAKGMPL